VLLHGIGAILQNFYGNFYLRGTDLLALPCIDCDKAYAVEMKNDESVMTTNSLSIQSALLYTTSSGERRIRVHNVCVPVSSALHELYQATNVNAMTNLLAKQAVDMALAQTLAKARDALRLKCVSIMRTYRSTIAVW
jgi:protein transport protein SEC24